MIRRTAADLLMAIIVLLAIAWIVNAQVSASVPNCGYIAAYPSDSYGNMQNTIATGQAIYLTLRSQYSCTAYLTVTIRDPTGGMTTIINNRQISLSAGTNTVIELFQVSTANPSGQWIIYATLNGVGIPPLAVEVNPPPPASSPPQNSSMWLIVTMVAVAIVIVMAAIYLITRKRVAYEERTKILPQPVQPSATVTEARDRTKVGVILYRLRLSNGMEIPVNEPYKIFGRETFERYGLPKDSLDLITREDRGGHIKIYLRGMRWYIEDSGSTNGTLLNGVEIKGKGPQELKDGDTISPGGVINLTFQIEKAEVK